jgi:hypothetical protein
VKKIRRGLVAGVRATGAAVVMAYSSRPPNIAN